MITIEQIRAGRAMLGWKQKDLALKAGISIATLNNIERAVQTDPKISTMRAIQNALENGGIEFSTGPLGEVGVSLKPRAMDIDHAMILIVDDNKADRTLFRTWLSQAPGKNYSFTEAGSAKEGFDAFVQCKPQCIILDFMMYGADGFQLMAELRKEHTKLPPIIFVTGMHNEHLEQNAFSEGVHTYLNKQNLTKEILNETVARALKA